MSDVREERDDDIEAVRQMLTAAFESDAEARLVDALRSTHAWMPEFSVVAEENGEVVAFALLSRIMIGGETGLALGPVAVLPDRQKQGLGAEVIKDALRRATEAGERLVLVLGDPAYYKRFGFVPAAPFGIISDWSSAGDAWQVLALNKVKARYPSPWRNL
ncbi:GNAT family N-acetyltransferase [Actinoplanes friuliensis]|uniref:GCN5-like N-acetyltransferase n=1 Tax=Actinoplanes friuliensis DSM 7358 TaxID=1246995 RepID=U5WFI0_9ACTN|nr:N-acetyltransferase [Actinoplanes friuliensis]AGZ46795.1 GCN5-like N-acetyltransferase [Actinoplanes friuliensis DSM 7358]